MRRLAVVCGVLAAGIGLAAQQAQYSVEVRLIEVEVRVTDRDGEPVTALKREDFQLRENDVPHDVATLLYIAPPHRLEAEIEARDADPTMAVVAPQRTWIYVSPEAAPNEIGKTIEALRRFVLEDLQPGFQVSIAGYAFTDDRQTLLQRIDLMARTPFGVDGKGRLVDGTRQIYDDMEAERALAATLREQEEGIVPLQGFFSRPERIETDASLARQPYLTEGRMDRQLPLYGQVAIRRYESLVAQLAPLPGKKVVVLMRPGLRLEADNVPALRRLASLSVRNRVSFYTVDTRGLDPIIPANETYVSFTVDRSRRPTVNVFSKMEMHGITQDGLISLATETHGRATIDNNRLSQAFEDIRKDSSGYYLLGYHPVDLTASGRFRRIKVAVKYPGLKVNATRGYYEPPAPGPFGGGDSDAALRRGLLADLPTDLAVVGSAAVFIGPQQRPTLVLSGGVPVGALKPETEKDASQLEATALVRIASDDLSQLPIHYERRLASTIDRETLPGLQKDRTAVLTMADVVALKPGHYTWRIVVQDDHSGKLGGVEGRIEVPAFTSESTPSSVLMTSEVLRRVEGGEGEGEDVLHAGPLRFTPQPLRVFRKGTLVHLRFDLYNPTAGELAAAETGGPRLALLKDGKPIDGPAALGDAFPDAVKRRIQYACAIDTTNLEPGSYTVLLAPAGGSGGDGTKPLVQIFMLLPEA